MALFLHHLVIAVAMIAVLRSGAGGTGRLARAGAVLPSVALVALGGMELAAISAAHVSGDVPALDAGSGIATIATGIGLLLLGVAVVRARAWSGRRRWLILVIGISVFVPLTPAAFGPLLVAMPALAVWSLLLAAVGAALLTGRPRSCGRQVLMRSHVLPHLHLATASGRECGEVRRRGGPRRGRGRGTPSR